MPLSQPTKVPNAGPSANLAQPHARFGTQHLHVAHSTLVLLHCQSVTMRLGLLTQKRQVEAAQSDIDRIFLEFAGR